MKLIRTEDAVGHVLCHDMTQIIRGVTKDAVFRKGHVVREEDIPVLLSIGKEHLYVWEKDETMLHENEAAQVLYEISAGPDMHPSEIKEGKIELIADIDGLLKVDRDLMRALNSFGQMMIASRHGNTPVKCGDKLAGTRVIPLVIEKAKMAAAKEMAGDRKIFHILPYKLQTAGIIATGSEIQKGRIKDTFTPVVVDKLSEYGIKTLKTVTPGDDSDLITENILQMADEGLDLILCTGGMSVDPDDKTPLAIKNAGTRIVTYGAPVLPGAMFLLSYLMRDGRRIPVLGLPGCVMYAKRTLFDLMLPRIAAEDDITADEIAALGEGGLCLNCDLCTWPNCGFGKA